MSGIKLFNFSKDDEYKHALFLYPFRIFYNANGDDKSPKKLEYNLNKTIPDYVIKMLESFYKAYYIYTQEQNFKSPMKEGIFFDKGAKFIDILIVNIPVQKGLVSAELIDNHSYFKNIKSLHGKSVRILLDRNLINNTATPIHELFHVFQYNYCNFNNMWFMEGLARWSQNLTHSRTNVNEVLPSTLSKLENLTSRAHDAEYFWRELISKCNNEFYFVKILLEQCEIQANILEDIFRDENKYNENNWSRQDKRSPQNNKHIFQAIIDTIKFLEINPDDELQAFIKITKKANNKPRTGTITVSNINENELSKFESIEIIDGDLIIDSIDLKLLKCFNKLKKVNTIIIKNNKNLVELFGFDALKSVKNIEISNNPELQGIHGFKKLFKKNDSIDGYIKIIKNDNLKSVEFLRGIKKIGSSLYLHQNNLTDLKGLEELKEVDASLSLSSNELEDISALSNLEYVNGILGLSHNKLKTLHGIENLQTLKTTPWNSQNRTLNIHGNKDLYDISALKNILTSENYMIVLMDDYEQYTHKPEADSNFHKNILELYNRKTMELIPTYKFVHKDSHDYDNFNKTTHSHTLEHLFDFELDSDILVISFSGRGGYLGGIFNSRHPFIINKVKTNKIFIMDKSDSWYHNGIDDLTDDINETISFIKTIKDRKKYSKVLCVGASMGGYMALLVGRLIGATNILALSAQTFLDTKNRNKYQDDRWEKSIGELNTLNREYLDLKPLYEDFNEDCNVEIHYSKDNELDVIHANHLENKNIKTIGYEHSDHYLAAFLHKKNMLEGIILGHLGIELPKKFSKEKLQILCAKSWENSLKKSTWLDVYHMSFKNIDKIIDYSKNYGIEILFANNYSSQLAIFENQDKLKNAGLKFIVNSKKTLKNLVDKQLFYEIMLENGFGEYVPKYYKKPKEVKFPCMVKIKSGGAGRGMFIAHSKKDLKKLEKNMILSEYLPSKTEYATSIFLKDGKILKHATYAKTSNKDVYILQHEKKKDIKTEKSDTPFLELFEKIIRIMSGDDKYCQCSINYKIQDGIPKIFEINPRIGYTLSRFPDDFKEMMDCYLEELEVNNG